jgi:6,7-dimethyl-8-ribityllumazine synthase
MRIALVASRFNEEVVDKMVDRAVSRAKEAGVDVAEIIRVPGTFEIPLAVHRVLARTDIDAAVALGAVIKGETSHDELIANAAAAALLEVSLRTGKPVGLGITGPDMTYRQALARIDSAVRAVDAVVAMHRLLHVP